MDGYFIRLCWKNVWRNRRRTLLSVGAIAFGVMALVAIRNYYDAFHEQIVQNVIQYQSGHLMLTAPGYQARSSQTLFLESPAPLRQWLGSHPEVKSWSERVQVQGLLSSPRDSANILFVGVDPEPERSVTRFASKMVAGEYLAAGDSHAIVLGEALSQLLGAQVGSKVVALTQGVDGSIGNELFRVRGIFRTQSDADRALAFISLDDARALSSLPAGAVHQISVVLANEERVDAIQKDFGAAFPEATAKVQALTWKELQRHVMAMIELDKAVNRLLMMIILSVASLGIANTILMSIMERTREFGVMMTVGATKKGIVLLMIGETLIIALVGVALGNALGLGVTLFFGKTGFDLAWLTSQKLVIDGTIVQTISYPTIQWGNSLAVTLAVLALSLLASLIPARHIAGLRAIKALRPV
jgi:ABC-type lipoprotein release transport system permease subunit